MSDLTVPVEQTIVKVSTIIKDGVEISQDYPVNHPKGCTPAQIFVAALGLFKNIGGLFQDDPTGAMFYPVQTFLSPVKFEIKNIVLARASSLPKNLSTH